MILIDIIQGNENKAKEISNFLIENKYALQTHVDVNTLYDLNENKSTIRLYFITKALLFDSIEQEINTNFYSNDLIIYATPISHISKELGEILRKNIKAV
ncbi:MAG: hypothetical protein SFY56_09860 [Bacteroidota bacterium]|nr:hypothetical protein [Bacteroidota bacterium]